MHYNYLGYQINKSLICQIYCKFLSNYLLLKPFLCIFLDKAMTGTYSAFASSSSGNSGSWPAENNIEIHSVDSNAGVIFNTKIDVLLNSKAKVPSSREVSFFQFVFSNLKITSRINSCLDDFLFHIIITATKIKT